MALPGQISTCWRVRSVIAAARCDVGHLRPSKIEVDFVKAWGSARWLIPGHGVDAERPTITGSGEVMIGAVSVANGFNTIARSDDLVGAATLAENVATG